MSEDQPVSEWTKAREAARAYTAVMQVRAEIFGQDPTTDSYLRSMLTDLECRAQAISAAEVAVMRGARDPQTSPEYVADLDDALRHIQMSTDDALADVLELVDHLHDFDPARYPALDWASVTGGAA